MKKILIWVFLSAIVLINTGCPKSCVEANYSFAVHSHIMPDMANINIGDTIYFVSSFPTQLQDQNTSTLINYSGAKSIGSTLAVRQLITTENLAKDAVFNFTYFSVMGTIFNDRNIPSPDGVQQLVYQEVNGRYELKIGLIPKVSGVYVLGMGNGISVSRNGSAGCEKASFNITLENTNQHFDLLYAWNPNAQFYGDGKSRAYYVKVR